MTTLEAVLELLRAAERVVSDAIHMQQEAQRKIAELRREKAELQAEVARLRLRAFTQTGARA